MSLLSDTPYHLSFFFFNDTATTEIYTLSLHDALPIFKEHPIRILLRLSHSSHSPHHRSAPGWQDRSEEHTSELQSQSNLVCRLLLEKKKTLSPSATTPDVPSAT